MRDKREDQQPNTDQSNLKLLSQFHLNRDFNPVLSSHCHLLNPFSPTKINRDETSITLNTGKRVPVRRAERVSENRRPTPARDAHSESDFRPRSRMGGVCPWKNTVRRVFLLLYTENAYCLSAVFLM